MTTVPDNFLSGANALYVAELYARYLDNASTVDQHWADWFSGLDDDSRSVLGELHGASWAPSSAGVVGAFGANGNGAGGEWMEPDGAGSGGAAPVSVTGAGVTASGTFSVQAVRWMGLAMLALGSLALLRADLGLVLLAVGFGGLHVAFGLYIAQRHGG